MTDTHIDESSGEKPATAQSTSFVDELRDLINRHSMENGSDTPDFILAGYLRNCLIAFEQAMRHRDRWYGRVKAGL